LKIKPALRLSFIISLFYFIFLFFKKKKMKGDTRHNWPSGDMADIKCQKKKETRAKRHKPHTTRLGRRLWLSTSKTLRPPEKKKKGKKLQRAIIPSPVRFDIKTLSSF
jgi:hypothetical protein